VLFVAVIGAAVAAVFGIGVAKRLSPYSAEDPSTQDRDAQRGGADRTRNPVLRIDQVPARQR
jgi:hypothetical protein